MEPPTQTVRFSQVAKKAGQPTVVSIWGEPDAAFKRALKLNRVMTLKIQTIGTKKEFGVVGFLKEKNVSYLMFSKSLNPFKDKRIIGIKYELTADAKAVGKSEPSNRLKPKTSLAKQSSERELPPPKEPPPTPHFNVRVRYIATVEGIHDIEAENASQAHIKM